MVDTNLIEAEGIVCVGSYRTYTKVGPTIEKILEYQNRRDNIIITRDSRFTEREGLENLNLFLNETIDLAQRVGDKEIEDLTKAFRENLVYIGEPELKEATTGMALYILEQVKTGKEAYIFAIGERSERYISIRVLEDLINLTKEDIKTRSHVHYSNEPYKISGSCKKFSDPKIFVVDDFAISGLKITSFAGNILQWLVMDSNYTPKQSPLSPLMVEALLVAAPIRDSIEDNIYKFYYIGVQRFPLKIHCYYGVQEYKDKSETWHCFPGVSITGTHSSVDFGFEEVIKKLAGFHSKNNSTTSYPLPVNIRRPYELKNYPSNKYIDQDLQKRFEKVVDTFGLIL